MKADIRCTTFDFQKSIEFWAGHTAPTVELKERFRTLSEAKRAATVWLSRNPEAYAKVQELKKVVHEFYVHKPAPPLVTEAI